MPHLEIDRCDPDDGNTAETTAIEPMSREEVLAMQGFWADRPPLDIATLRSDGSNAPRGND